MTDPRHLCGASLVGAMHAARQATLDATLDLTDDQWRVPIHPSIQPTAWDLAHIGWFAEFWLLRGPHRLGIDAHVHAEQPARWFGPDAHYDSARVAHRTRWEIDLPSRSELLDRLDAQSTACCERVLAAGDDPELLYHARFSLYHELMHVEALAWTRALLGYRAPTGLALPLVAPGPDVSIPAGTVRVGWPEGDTGFAFDNERAGRTVELRAFAIDAAAVTNAAFLAFVEAGGYDRTELWPGPAGRWRALAGRNHPERWRRAPRGAWEQRWFDRWVPLDPDQPVIHVNAWEAEAFCRHAGRRLPTAAEWEAAAAQIQWGSTVWEWTADAFAPYPGFRPGPYHTYSTPWFHHQRELRGGAFAAHPLMHHRRYRNFFLPQRSDVFAGFRTVQDAT